jgi:hypothetical protein
MTNSNAHNFMLSVFASFSMMPISNDQFLSALD